MLDDTHWADRPTLLLLLLSHLSSSVIPRVLLVAGYPDSNGEPPKVSELVGWLARTAMVTRCALRVLRVEEVATANVNIPCRPAAACTAASLPSVAQRYRGSTLPPEPHPPVDAVGSP